MSEKRQDPTVMAWQITPNTAMPTTRSFHEVKSDEWVIEEYDEDAGRWVRSERGLRLTCYREDYAELMT